jgi:hypothetical protein
MNKKLIFSVMLTVCLLAVVPVVAFAQQYPQTYMNYVVTHVNGNKGSVTVAADNPSDAETQGRKALNLTSNARVSVVLDTSGPKHDPSENTYANYIVTHENGSKGSVTVAASSPSDAEAQGRKALSLTSNARVSVRL